MNCFVCDGENQLTMSKNFLSLHWLKDMQYPSMHHGVIPLTLQDSLDHRWMPIKIQALFRNTSQSRLIGIDQHWSTLIGIGINYTSALINIGHWSSEPWLYFITLKPWYKDHYLAMAKVAKVVCILRGQGGKVARLYQGEWAALKVVFVARWFPYQAGLSPRFDCTTYLQSVHQWASPHRNSERKSNSSLLIEQVLVDAS